MLAFAVRAHVSQAQVPGILLLKEFHLFGNLSPKISIYLYYCTANRVFSVIRRFPSFQNALEACNCSCAFQVTARTKHSMICEQNSGGLRTSPKSDGGSKNVKCETLCDSLTRNILKIRLVRDSNPGLQIQSLLC